MRGKGKKTLREQVAALEALTALTDDEARATNGGFVLKRPLKPVKGTGAIMTRGSGAIAAPVNCYPVS
jgi:hypothetical protein